MTQPRYRTVLVDGITVRVRGGGDWSEADYEAFTEIVRAAVHAMNERTKAEQVEQ